MPTPPPAAYALLESSSAASPTLRSHKPLPRQRDDIASVPHDSNSPADSEDHTPLASPEALNRPASGLPPTPPSNSQDGIQHPEFNAPPHADGVVASLSTRKSTLSTPVNQRSPPTPDPSPPRTNESMPTPERPALLAYPSSRAESFTTAREDQFSSEPNSRAATPLADRLAAVQEDCGLGLAFEREDDDITPRNTIVAAQPATDADVSTDAPSRDVPNVDDIPNREWDTNLMRNVTVRRKRNPKPSPSKEPAEAPVSASPVPGSTPRRSTSLRERVEASKNSPHTPSMENFAKAIGWPTDLKETPSGRPGSIEGRRLSGSSVSSTVVEAMVIVTPPQRRRTLRHSGKNLAYRRNTDSPIELASTHSNRNSMNSDDIPLHRLVHKRASINDRVKRISTDSDTLGARTASPLSIEKRRQDSVASTLAHQESIRRVLQPAAEIMSRSNSVTRSTSNTVYHKRISSAPEPVIRRETPPLEPPTLFEFSPPDSPSPRKQRRGPSKLAQIEAASPPPSQREPEVSSPKSPTVTSPSHKLRVPWSPPNVNKSLPELPNELPIKSTDELSPQNDAAAPEPEADEKQPPSALLERVRHLLAEREAADPAQSELRQPRESPRPRASSTDTIPTVRRGSVSTRGRSEERRRSFHSQDRTSPSQDTLRPSMDRAPTEEIPRTSHEWHSFHTDEHGRISFDRSTARTEEHAMARHLFAQTTPFSQFSDTPIEVSEATAVSIYPHNNHSLLVVQQVSRASAQPVEQPQVINMAHITPSHSHDPDAPPTPPFVDAHERPHEQLEMPALTFEPSTPPMQIALPTPGAVDSPLKNPRKPPEPPVIKFIPPTPAEELERQLPPGPPKRSDSHPQRRLSLKQRARHYSDNFISPFLARASSIRSWHASDSHAEHDKPRIPTVTDEDGSLHPFWRPRGFWDGFEDSDSDGEDVLPRGGDTSDVEDPEHEPSTPRKLGNLGRRLTNGFKGSGGFLIGNSLGMERAGTNKRRPHIDLPSRRASHAPAATADNPPKILIQPPTLPLRTRFTRVEKRGSRSSLRSSGSYERPRRGSRRDAWRQGKNIPGLKRVQVQYIGISGVKERLREKRAERRREALRKSIGGRWYVEPGTPGAAEP